MHSQFGDWLKIHSDKKWFQRMRTSLTDELETRMNKYDGMKNNHKSSLLHASLWQLLRIKMTQYKLLRLYFVKHCTRILEEGVPIYAKYIIVVVYFFVNIYFGFKYMDDHN